VNPNQNDQDDTIRWKLYHGMRVNGQCGVSVYSLGRSTPLDPALDVRRHSPDGFNWGYGGSGPAQLALALLLNVSGDIDTALAFYQRFKAEIIVGLDADDWTLGEGQIRDWLIRARKGGVR
jgi:Family of unknown function (DUF6166)